MQYSKEYRQLTKVKPPEGANVIDLIDKGLPLEAVEQVAIMFEINRSHAALLLGVSIRALQSRKQENKVKTLPLQESDRALQLTRLMNDAVEYFGSLESANRWMKTLNKGLGDKQPIELCNTGVGMSMVRDSINRLKYGMTA